MYAVFKVQLSDRSAGHISPEAFLNSDHRQIPKKGSGSHLLSHTVSSAVPSAAQVLTIVFGMGTGVSPERIATGNIPLPLGN